MLFHHPTTDCTPAQQPIAVLAEQNWFAAYTTARHEKHVCLLLQERGIECFLPLYSTQRQWKKSRPVRLELPLFPTYVFVRIEREKRSTVLSTPGVLSIVGSSREPWPLSDAEMQTLMRGTQLGCITPHPCIPVGEEVRIVSGMMQGTTGILLRHKNGVRVVVALHAIMKSFALEVDLQYIEPIRIPA